MIYWPSVSGFVSAGPLLHRSPPGSVGETRHGNPSHVAGARVTANASAYELVSADRGPQALRGLICLPFPGEGSGQQSASCQLPTERIHKSHTSCSLVSTPDTAGLDPELEHMRKSPSVACLGTCGACDEDTAVTRPPLAFANGQAPPSSDSPKTEILRAEVGHLQHVVLGHKKIIEGHAAKLDNVRGELRELKELWRTARTAALRGLLSCGATREPAQPFTILLDRSRCFRLGLDLEDFEDTGMLQVARVDDCGLVADWNRTHPAIAVAPGDVIGAVNGAQEARAMLHRLVRDSVLEVTLVRR